MLQMKEQDKKLQKKELHEMEIHNVPDKEFEIMTIKMLTVLNRRL